MMFSLSGYSTLTSSQIISNLHICYPKPKYLILGSFGPLQILAGTLRTSDRNLGADPLRALRASTLGVSGFRVQGLGFRVEGLGLGFRV